MRFDEFEDDEELGVRGAVAAAVAAVAAAALFMWLLLLDSIDDETSAVRPTPPFDR